MDNPDRSMLGVLVVGDVWDLVLDDDVKEGGRYERTVYVRSD